MNSSGPTSNYLFLAILNKKLLFLADLCTPANEKPPLNATMSQDNDPLCRMFREKQYGTIDVWWLYDDGGKHHVFSFTH